MLSSILSTYGKWDKGWEDGITGRRHRGMFDMNAGERDILSTCLCGSLRLPIGVRRLSTEVGKMLLCERLVGYLLLLIIFWWYMFFPATYVEGLLNSWP